MHSAHLFSLLLLLSATSQLLADPDTPQSQQSITTLTSGLPDPSSIIQPTKPAKSIELPSTTIPSIVTVSPIVTTTSTSFPDKQAVSTPEAPIATTTTSSPAASPVAVPQEVSSTIAPSTIAAIDESSSSNTNATEISTPKPEPLIVGIKTIIDLSYPLEDGTLHWPKNYGFTYLNDTDGELVNTRNETYYVKSDGLKMAVHTGTHLDAPRHFGRSGWTVDQIPLERLIDVPFKVIDLSKIISVNRTYEFTRNDFIDRETNKPLVTANSVVLVYTGISKFYYQGEKEYFGTDTRNISEMKIPGFSGDAAKFMVEMGVYGVGLDSPSADSSTHHSPNERYDPEAHTIFNSNNIYILENINNRLSELVNNDEIARLTIAPLPIKGGSGSPVRLVAVTTHNDCPMALNSAYSVKSPTALATLMAVSLMIATILII